MKKIIFLILISTFSLAQISAPFSNKKEGNDFREWVNENHPKYAKEINLGRSGSHTNSYILKAYKKFGKDYLKEITPPPKINVNAIATKISQKKIKQHIAVLSSDYFEGREVGEPGEEKAAKYMSAYFSKIGIPPYNDTTYFQEFKLVKRSFVNIDLQVSGKKYEQNKEYFSFPMFPPTVIKSDEVLFLGYGIETNQYNDYQQDVEGKVIMILQGEPIDKNGNYIVSGSEKKSPKRSWKEKLKTAKKNKAKAVIFISENFDKDYNLYKHRIEHEALNLLIKEDELPFVYINKSVTEKILGRNKIERFKKEISTTKNTLNRKIKKSVLFTTKTKEKIKTGKNRLGFI